MPGCFTRILIDKFVKLFPILLTFLVIFVILFSKSPIEEFYDKIGIYNKDLVKYSIDNKIDYIDYCIKISKSDYPVYYLAECKWTFSNSSEAFYLISYLKYSDFEWKQYEYKPHYNNEEISKFFENSPKLEEYFKCM